MEGIAALLGYTGHVPGVVSENFFSKSFAKTTSTAMTGQFPRGADFPTHHRYVSQNAREYSPDNFRRFGMLLMNYC